MIPKHIRIKAKLIPIKKFEDSENLATGEIRKFPISQYSDSILGLDGDYSIMWKHIGSGYFKQIVKTYQRNC